MAVEASMGTVPADDPQTVDPQTVQVVTPPENAQDQDEADAAELAAHRQDKTSKLSEADRAELEEFRRTRDQQQQLSDEEAKRVAPPVTHTLLLANGESVESAGVMTSYNGIPVVNSVAFVKESDDK
jgi:hypothetical protein